MRALGTRRREGGQTPPGDCSVLEPAHKKLAALGGGTRDAASKCSVLQYERPRSETKGLQACPALKTHPLRKSQAEHARITAIYTAVSQIQRKLDSS